MLDAGLLLALGITICSGGQANKTHVPLDATVCSVSRNPLVYDLKKVRIFAQVESDGFEHTGLVDGACTNVAISLDYSSAIVGKEQLINAIADPLPGTVDKEISGVFTGKFEWHPKDRVQRVLVLEKVEKIKVFHK